MGCPSDDELETMARFVEVCIRNGHHPELDEAAAMLRACKRRVRVKPLEWVDLYRDGSRYEVSSDNPLGYTDSIHGLQDGTYHSQFGAFPTLESAKAAAQADYEARILAALDPAPDHSDWNAAIEAVGRLRGRDVQKRDAEDVGEAYDLAIDEAQDAIRALAKKGPHQ